MNIRVLLLLSIILFLSLKISGQTNRVSGLRENTPAVFAITNADIVTEPGNRLEDAVMVVRNGIIESVGRDVQIPADATILNMSGGTIYPGFIDMYSHLGLPAPEENSAESIHWNPQIRSHYSSGTAFRHDDEEASSFRKQGFVAALTTPKHGLLTGQGSIVSLGEGSAKQLIIQPDVVQGMTFQPSDKFDERYPTSTMGAIALIRQTFLDAEWFDEAHKAFQKNPGLERPESNQALHALTKARFQHTPFLADADNETRFLQVAAMADEFNLDMWVRGSGYEYRRINHIRETGLPVILPLDFPDAPDVSAPEKAREASLETLRHWLLAPENPAKLAEAGIPMAFTSHGSDDSFLNNLRTAVARGLDREDAMAALTTTPAGLLGISERYGRLEEGKAASFIITDDDIFSEGSVVMETWIDGTRFRNQPEEKELRGTYTISAGNTLDGATLIIEGSEQALQGYIIHETDSMRLQEVKDDRMRLTMRFQADKQALANHYRLSAQPGVEELLGLGETSDGQTFNWSATRTRPFSEENNDENTQSKAHDDLPDIPVRYPSMDYGYTEKPEAPDNLIIRNATIWTQGPEGILEDADILISEGKIVEVGRNLSTPFFTEETDAAGRHVTPGLIDPHIHSSIAGGVNETGDAITAETRIKDVMQGNNVWLYRLLAGGITSAKLFHGSANPIGGQDATIKTRWGEMAEDLLIKDAAPGLKMALGENVKRLDTRYPTSRQGTEQIIKDAFQAAKEYERKWETWEEDGEGLPPRKDLQLEAILEVINEERKAHVHAYRQDEMLMMMRLAEDFGFTIGSFEHTLEGYKIADELRKHGAGAVIWSDWSSFKVEAYDGILYNARLLNEAGALTSLHSDNTQLSTRMNWEAAKTMKTGVDEVDALNFITLHPAKIMGIDHRTGSLEEGKDADFVIWNGHPMSTRSTPDQTWVDGKKYFDREDDKQMREEVMKERTLIINLIHKDNL